MLFLRARLEPLRYLVSPCAKGDNIAAYRREGSALRDDLIETRSSLNPAFGPSDLQA
jgi:hypothetical protein